MAYLCIFIGSTKKTAPHPKGYWSYPVQRSFMDELAKKLKITEQDSWYNIKWSTLIQNGAGTLLTKYNGSTFKLLKSVYPEYHINFDTYSSD